jgi:hypothetical protein
MSKQTIHQKLFEGYALRSEEKRCERYGYGWERVNLFEVTT